MNKTYSVHVCETVTSLGGLMLSHAPFLMNKKACKFNKPKCNGAASNSLTLEWPDHHCHAICAIMTALCDKQRRNGQTYFWCGQIITVLLFALSVCCVTNIGEIDLADQINTIKLCHNSIGWQTLQQVTNIGWCEQIISFRLSQTNIAASG